MKLHIQWFAVVGVVLAGGVALAGMGCSSSSTPAGGGTCAADPTVTGCAAGDGYSCAAGDSAPDVADTSLTCSVPVTGADGSDTYCCVALAAPPAGTCSPDPSLDSACPDPDSFGYSCASGDNPMTYDPTLTCSDNPAATGDFCCYTAPVTGGNSCTPDSSVMGCIASDGYSCAAGDPAPDVSDTSLTCSTPTTGAGGADTYCCYTSPNFPAGTCTSDPSMDSTCPDPESFYYSCAGADTPEETDSSLNCSMDTGMGTFCCTI